MKFIKKLTSVVCAIGMLASMSASMIVTHANTTLPKLDMSYVWTDEAAGKGTITVSVSGLKSDNDGEYYVMAGAQALLALESRTGVETFDNSLYSAMKIANNWSAQSFFKSSDYGKMSLTRQSDKYKLMMTYNADTDQKVAQALGGIDPTDEHVLFTVDFVVKDTTQLPLTVGISAVEFNIDALDEEGSSVGLTYWGNAQGIDKEMNITDTITIKASDSATPTPEAPTPTPEAPTPEPTPEVTPEPVNGVEKFSDTDAAAWAWETAAAAGTKVAVTVTDGTKEATKEFDLNANVEATVKVGVVVQYNPTAFPTFGIVKVEVK